MSLPMGLVVFEIGGLLLLSSFVVNFLEYRACQRIHKTTKDDENGLTDEETWLNLYQFRKWEKLQYFAEKHSDSALKADAARAMRLEKLFYALIVPGMVLMAIGAATQR